MQKETTLVTITREEYELLIRAEMGYKLLRGLIKSGVTSYTLEKLGEAE
ncbi:MAG: hypothetical protein IJP43_04885 [Oscillospiraceae bacterium]|nr:hypothetical protein [Oscillospiraceae bacterium]